MDVFGVFFEKILVVGDYGYDVIVVKNVGVFSFLVMFYDVGRMSFLVEVIFNFEIFIMEYFILLMGWLLLSYVVVFVYNEEKIIGLVFIDFLCYFRCEEIVVVNDGLKDRIEEIVRFFGVYVFIYFVNRGFGGAFGMGFVYVVRKGVKMIFIFDVDG